MSKKKNYNQERNPLQMVLYTGIVLALLIFLLVLLLQNKKKQEAFEENVKNLTAQETEMVMTERKPREETEAETDAPEANTTAQQTEQNINETDETVQSEAANEMLDENAASANVLVLNGTKRPGVAGTWEVHLEEKGFANVYTATYSEALEQTLIYTDDAELGEALKAEFTNAVVHPGTVESGIEMTEGEPLPETIDAYVIIGKNEVAIP